MILGNSHLAALALTKQDAHGFIRRSDPLREPVIVEVGKDQRICHNRREAHRAIEELWA